MLHFIQLNQEYKSLMKSQKPNSNKGFKHERQSWNRKAAPDAVDWRTSGCVRSPQDQGQMCDPWPIVSVSVIHAFLFHQVSCYKLFQSKTCKILQTVSIEVPNCVHHGQLVRLSEQNLIDCSSNEGCGQGTVDNAYIYVEQAGIDTEASYPTTGIVRNSLQQYKLWTIEMSLKMTAF